MAQRHLVEGRARVARQRWLIRELEAAGQPTDLAEQLLTSLVEALRQMRIHRDYLEDREREG